MSTVLEKINQVEKALPNVNNEGARRLACRQMVHADMAAVTDLLHRGFPNRKRAYWERAIAIMSERAVPPICPRFGYVLTADQSIVGVILLIFSAFDDPDHPRCNISSWYVDPDYRTYASWLISAPLKNKKATYVNMSAAPHTRQTVQAQGFTCYAEGVILATPMFASLGKNVRLKTVSADDTGSRDIALLAEHARYGCISLVCETNDGCYPFVFLRRSVPHTIVPCAQLIYCSDIADVARFAGPLGRYLLWRGMPVLMMDANGPMRGMPGRYFPGRSPKYRRGPIAPRLGDLAFSEAVLFGT